MLKAIKTKPTAEHQTKQRPFEPGPRVTAQGTHPCHWPCSLWGDVLDGEVPVLLLQHQEVTISSPCSLLISKVRSSKAPGLPTHFLFCPDKSLALKSLNSALRRLVAKASWDNSLHSRLSREEPEQTITVFSLTESGVRAREKA